MHRSSIREKGDKLAGKVKNICEEKIVPVIEEMGYEVIEVEYAKKSDGMNLTFFIDNDNGIKIEDCEKVSKAIDGLLDEINPTDDQSYILNVSSPGIDRPLKNDRDYKRNLNKMISVTLFAKEDGKKTFEGKLTNFDKETLTIEIDGKEKVFNKKNVAHVMPVISL